MAPVPTCSVLRPTSLHPRCLLALSTVLVGFSAAGLLDKSVELGDAVYMDGEKCFLGMVTYEMCCTPVPNDDCWDDYYTADKCCHGVAVRNPSPPAGSEASEQGVQMPEVGAVGGNPECWFASITYENCCLPEPNLACFAHDKFFTPERCCYADLDLLRLSPLDRLREELLTDVDPYGILDHVAFLAEEHYPDSHLTAEIVRGIIAMLAHMGQEASLWVEVGSFIGGSAVTTAETVKDLNLSTGIVCIDPFTGDVGMWSTRKAMRIMANHPNADSALKMDQYGHSRIYETFLANVRKKGHNDIVMPLRISSISGLRLIQALWRDKRIQVLPQVVYLDSAHEEGETLLEVRTAWNLLPAPGILFGDDWSWPGVRGDVETFADQMRLPSFSDEELRLLDTSQQKTTQPRPGIAIINEHNGTWVMLKREGDPPPRGISGFG